MRRAGHDGNSDCAGINGEEEPGKWPDVNGIEEPAL